MDPTFERFLDEIRKFLKEARSGELSNEDEEYLRILTDTKKHLENLQETGECDHTEILKNLCQAVLYGDYITAKNNYTVYKKKVNQVKEAESKGMPEILQPKIKEIKGYFAKLCELIEKMDNLAKKISDKIDDFGTRDYKLTEKERIEVKFLNIDFETVKKKTADYYEQAERVLKMFGADVASYKKDKTNNYLVYAGFAVIATAVTGGAAAAGAIVATVGATGGGAAVAGALGATVGAAGGYTSGNSSNATLAYSNEFQQHKSYTLPYIVGTTVALTGLVVSLTLLWKGWAAKRNFCDKLLLILRDYRDLIDESQRISLQSV